MVHGLLSFSFCFICTNLEHAKVDLSVLLSFSFFVIMGTRSRAIDLFKVFTFMLDVIA